jgi:hypothetical protein
MNNEFISLKRVVEDVIQNHPFVDYEIDWAKIVGITARTLKLFGIPQYYINKKHIVDIEDHRGELPENYLYFDLFINCKTKLPLKYTGDESLINLHGDCLNATQQCNCESPVPSNGSYTFKGHLPIFSSFCDSTFRINEHFIFTSFKEGQVAIYYRAIPVDDEGYPMIPDNEAFIRALELQIAKQIAYELWVMDKLSDKVYQEVKRNASWAKANAIGEHRIPDKDRLEYWLHSFRLTLIPNIHNHSNRFAWNRQHIVNHTTNNFQQGSIK